MKRLSDDTLIFSYYRAVELKLDENFINMLLEEIHNRKLDIHKPVSEPLNEQAAAM